MNGRHRRTMDNNLILNGVLAIIVLGLILIHLSLRKSIAKDAREVVGHLHNLYIERERDGELIIQDSSEAESTGATDRYGQINQTQPILHLQLHREKAQKRKASK